MGLNNFTVLDSEYGRFIVNRHCAFQAESLVKTGLPHIQPELEKILRLVSRLPDACVVVDAGANIGLVSLPIAKAIEPRGGVVHAFEVQRMLYYALCGTAALNDLASLFVYNQALGSSPGRLGATLPDYGRPQDFGLFSLVDQSIQGAETVPVVTIDGLDLARLDFLKIDVEGMEIEVLKGARESIARYRPLCWIEYWKVDVNDLKAQFSGLGYVFYVMDSLNLLAAPPEKLADMQISVTAPAA